MTLTSSACWALFPVRVKVRSVWPLQSRSMNNRMASVSAANTLLKKSASVLTQAERPPHWSVFEPVATITVGVTDVAVGLDDPPHVAVAVEPQVDLAVVEAEVGDILASRGPRQILFRGPGRRSGPKPGRRPPPPISGVLTPLLATAADGVRKTRASRERRQVAASRVQAER